MWNRRVFWIETKSWRKGGKFLEETLELKASEDGSDAGVAALTEGKAGERYLLGSCNCTLREFFGDLARMSGRPAPLLTAPKGVTRFSTKLLERLHGFGLSDSLPVNHIDMEMAGHGWYIDSSKAKVALGFEPRDPAETLRDTIDDVEERL